MSALHTAFVAVGSALAEWQATTDHVQVSDSALICALGYRSKGRKEISLLAELLLGRKLDKLLGI